MTSLREYSDEDLLMELRRRGILARVEGHSIAAEIQVQAGYPIERQIQGTISEVIREIARMVLNDGVKIPGMKTEIGQFITYDDPPLYEITGEKDRKVTIPLNFVVERKDKG